MHTISSTRISPCIVASRYHTHSSTHPYSPDCNTLTSPQQIKPLSSLYETPPLENTKQTPPIPTTKKPSHIKSYQIKPKQSYTKDTNRKKIKKNKKQTFAPPTISPTSPPAPCSTLSSTSVKGDVSGFKRILWMRRSVWVWVRWCWGWGLDIFFVAGIYGDGLVDYSIGYEARERDGVVEMGGWSRGRKTDWVGGEEEGRMVGGNRGGMRGFEVLGINLLNLLFGVLGLRRTWKIR